MGKHKPRQGTRYSLQGKGYSLQGTGTAYKAHQLIFPQSGFVILNKRPILGA